MRHRTILSCSRAALLLGLAFAGDVRAQCPNNDAFEPNDTCATATPMTQGAYVAVMTDFSEYDNYSFVVPAGGAFDMESSSDDWGAVADLGFTLYDGTDCMNGVLESTVASFTFGALRWENTTGADAPVTLQVRAAFTHPGIQCVNYSLDVELETADCVATGGADVYDPNGSCALAAIIGDGLISDLYVDSGYDPDYYKLAVQPGQALAVDLLFDDADADLALEIRRGLKQCEGQDPEPGGDDFVAVGHATPGGKSAVWVNDTGLAWSVFIHVDLAGFPVAGCGLYDMRVARFDAGIGTPYCFGDGSAGVACPCGNAAAPYSGCANSRGHGAILTANGTASVANDDLSFRVTNGAPNQPFLLLQGATVIALPFKDGVLCMGNPTRRLEVVFMDGAGTGATIESVVTNGAVLPGQTRQYQAWYRDPLSPAPCTARSNLTQALELVWE